MKAELFFDRKYRGVQGEKTAGIRYRIEKEESRQLSPWSSDQHRTFKAPQQLHKLVFENTALKSATHRKQQNHHIEPPTKGRSLQLKPISGDQLSQDFYNLVRLQKKKVNNTSKDHPDVLPYFMNKIEMNLHFDSDDEEAKNHKDSLQLTQRSKVHFKQQPVKVKLSKKLKAVSYKAVPDPPVPFDPYDPFRTIPQEKHEKFTRMTERPTRRRSKPHHFQESSDVPLLGSLTVNGKNLQGDWLCRGNPIKNQVRANRKYRLVNQTMNQVGFLQRL